MRCLLLSACHMVVVLVRKVVLKKSKSSWGIHSFLYANYYSVKWSLGTRCQFFYPSNVWIRVIPFIYSSQLYPFPLQNFYLHLRLHSVYTSVPCPLTAPVAVTHSSSSPFHFTSICSHLRLFQPTLIPSYFRSVISQPRQQHFPATFSTVYTSIFHRYSHI